jgi:hypothetical protein
LLKLLITANLIESAVSSGPMSHGTKAALESAAEQDERGAFISK